MPNDRDIHHRRSIRLPAYDYRSAGAYFVTICTFQRLCLLDDPSLADAVHTAWRRAVCEGRDPAPWNFVVMPNHVHGIVLLPGIDARHTVVGAKHPRDRMTSDTDTSPRHQAAFGNKGASPLPGIDDVGRLVPPDRGSLGAVIGAFKSASAKRVNALRCTQGAPVWRRGYYERIIRDEDELATVRQYILDNPAKWAEDPDNPAVIATKPARSRPGSPAAAAAGS